MMLSSPDPPRRADIALVERGLAPSRSAAQRLISAGAVILVDSAAPDGPGRPLTKAATLIGATDRLRVVLTDEIRYVSRGGLKLAHALERVGLDCAGTRCLDVGQSTGGFTDCLLQAGARSVLGIDVGHAQLHPQLREDARVLTLEGVNARNLSDVALRAALARAGRTDMMPASGFDLIVVDVSFISLRLIIAALRPLLADAAHWLALVKPQFEVGPGHLDGRGVVRDTRLYDGVQAQIRQLAAAHQLRVLDWFDSPIAGGDGNHEFLMHCRPEPTGPTQ